MRRHRPQKGNETPSAKTKPHNLIRLRRKKVRHTKRHTKRVVARREKTELTWEKSALAQHCTYFTPCTHPPSKSYLYPFWLCSDRRPAARQSTGYTGTVLIRAGSSVSPRIWSATNAACNSNSIVTHSVFGIMLTAINSSGRGDTASFFVKELGLALAPKICPDQLQAFKEINNRRFRRNIIFISFFF